MSTESKNTVAENVAVAYSAKARNWGEPAFDELLSSLKRRGFGACAARLAYLHSVEDMEDDDAPLSLESARGCVNFVTGFSELGDTALLGLASSGALSVEWRIADDKHLGIWPLDGGHVAFAFTAPAEKPGEPLRLSGEGTIAKVIGILRQHGVDQWAKT